MSRAGSLRGYILIRIALMIPMVWVLLTVVFLMMRVAPGDPISATLGGKLSPEELARRQARARLRPADARAVPRLPVGRRPLPVRHDDHRRADDRLAASSRTAARR